MNDIAAELYTKLNETTIAFTIPIFGGIPVPESVVITWGIMAVLVLFTSTFILFLTGELFFTLYSFFTLPLGILYIYCIKKKIDGKWILRVYSMLKNYIVLFLLNSLLGLNTFTDAKDIYYSIVGVFPFLESDFLKNGMFIILWIVLSFSEVYIIKVYTNLFILRMNKNKMMK